MRSKNKLILTISFLISTLLLTACDGDDASTSTGTTPVAESESPIPNTTGIQLSLEDGIKVFGLSPTYVNAGKNISIENLNKGADKSSLIGSGFLKLSGFGSGDFGAVKGVQPKIIAECDKATKTCTTIPFKIIDGATIFDVQKDKYYAIQKK